MPKPQKPQAFRVSGHVAPLNQADYLQEDGAPPLALRVGMGEVESRGRSEGRRVVTIAFPVSEFEEARIPLSPDSADALAAGLFEIAACARGEIPTPPDAVQEREGATQDPLPHDMRERGDEEEE